MRKRDEKPKGTRRNLTKGTREHEPSARDVFTGEYEGKPKIYQLVRELNARTQKKPIKEHSHTLV